MRIPSAQKQGVDSEQEPLLKGESGLDDRRTLSFMSCECPYHILQIQYLLYVTSDDSAFTV